MASGYVYDPRHALHTHAQAPESAARLEGLMTYLQDQRALEGLVKLPVEPIPWSWIAAAHCGHYVETVRRLAEAGRARISVDTYLTPAAPAVARLGASSAVVATQAVLEGKVTNAFSLMRPPGHHAKSTQAMGYCIFNNVAIAAFYALREHGLKRVMIVDIDAHHGNGTEEIFYGSDEVLVISFHQHPWFPGTGDWYRSGAEAGLGYNYNIALPTWSNDQSYRLAFKEIVLPLAERYQPELILVSAGFDAHWLDHAAVLGLSGQGYYDLVAGLRALADQLCQGRLVLVLEGGYNLRSLGAGVVAALRALTGEPAPPDPLGPSPNPPVAPVGPGLTYLKGLMPFMRSPREPGFFDQPVEVPYQTK
ncbi:MAG TPA: histone deacetylase [Anaerolineae bacterium]|nr:histone deacetylase [Anaerolineae bacterium]